MVINPIIGFYIPIIRIPIKGGMTIPNIATFDHGTFFVGFLTLRFLCRCIFSACENLGAALLTMAAALTGAWACWFVGHWVGMGQICIKRDFPLPEAPGPSYGCFQKYGKTPQTIHFDRVFHYKPSILGYPYFWKQ